MDEIRYQVFVSSTFKDLKDEREKVLQALLEHKAFPAGMELFPSANDEQFEFIKREIDSSDYYILIVGGRYGSVAEDGVSFTEKEYDYAVSKNKPILTFLHYDIQKLPGEKLESTDSGRGKLDAFRAKVKSKRLVKFYENPDDLKSMVLASLISQFYLTPMRGWVRAGQTPREALEETNRLQRRVIELEEENSVLRKSREDLSSRLASNEDEIVWTFELADIKLGHIKLDQIEPVGVEYLFETTWGRLLMALFPSGSSSSRRQIHLELARQLASSLPDNEPELTWKKKMLGHLATNYIEVDWEPVSRIAAEIQRQFLGLGWIEEISETRYTGSLGQTAPRPYIEKLWKLTSKGNLQLALMTGYKR